MRKTRETTVRIVKESLGPPSDPVSLARDILLLPRGLGHANLIGIFREIVEDVDRKQQRFILSASKTEIPEEYFCCAEAFASLSRNPQTWVLSLVDTVFGKSQEITLSNAGYGGYPLFTEWGKAVQSAVRRDVAAIIPDDSYPLLGQLGEARYIELVETLRHLEELFIDTMEVIGNLKASDMPLMEEVCYRDRIPLIDPNKIPQETEQKLSLIAQGYTDANRSLLKLLFTHEEVRRVEIEVVKNSAGGETYHSAIVVTAFLLIIFYSNLEKMQKKPRGIAQTSPETSPSFDEALEQVADGLEHCGIPRDAAAVLAQGTIAAFQELAADKGVENAVESVRRGVLRIVEVEDGRRLNAVTEQEREEPVISINRDELLEVSADDFGGRLGSLLKEIEKGSCYSVSRNGQEIAWLLPLKQGEAIYVPTDFVSSTDINRSAGMILAQIAAGACLFVTRNNNKIAVLAPPQPDTPESLSPEAKLKAAYTAGVTTNDLKKLVTMFRDGIVGLSLDLGELGSVQITTLNQTGNKR